MSVAHALFGLVVFEMRSKGMHELILIATACVMWIFAEWLHAIMFSVFMLGPTSNVNAFYMSASIAYAFGHAANASNIA